MACGGSSSASANIQTALKLGSDDQLCSPGAQCLNVAATGPSLQSLQYYVTEIQICEDLTVTGTAFSDPTGCLQLFSHPEPANWTRDPNDLTDRLAAARASTDGWVDFMSANSRATLTQSTPLSAGDARSYQWGLITALPIVKVTATATQAGSNGDNPLYTHDGTTQICSVNNQSYTCVVSPTPLTQAPAEQAVFGGNVTGWFRFQAPFTISAGDISGGVRYSLDLAFDPDGLVQGVTNPGATNYPPLMDSATGAGTGGGGANTMSIAQIAMAPIAHHSSAQVMKETYRGTVTSPTDSFDLRVELFYLSDDPNKSIYTDLERRIPPELSEGEEALAAELRASLVDMSLCLDALEAEQST
jgi:hypothetical protein